MSLRPLFGSSSSTVTLDTGPHTNIDARFCWRERLLTWRHLPGMRIYLKRYAYHGFKCHDRRI